VVKWSQRYRATGSVAPGKIGGYRKPVLEPHRASIKERISQTPHLTLHKLKDELAARGVEVSHNAVWTGRGKANYCLNRRDAFACFLDDGRVRMSNNAAERKLWAVVVGRRNFDCRRTHERGERGLRSSPLIVSAKLSDIDSRSNLATRRIASSPFPRKEGDQKFRCARSSSRNVSWSLNS
jgi:hypothetical protein